MFKIIILITFILLIIFHLDSVSPTGPILLNTSITYLNATLFETSWELALVHLDFDQDLFLNEALVCPLGEQPPPPLPNCKACDLTSPAGGFVGQPNCEALFLSEGCCHAGILSLAEWCTPSIPFETLHLEEGANSTLSPIYSLNQSDVLYLRFHIDATRFWTPMRIFVRHLRGNTDVYYSNTQPYPSASDSLWQLSDLVFGYGYAQIFVDLCPAFLPSYSLGTYAVAIKAVIDAQFYLEIFHPAAELAPPPPLSPGALSCQEVSQLAEYAGAYCAEEGLSTEIIATPDQESQFISVYLPIQPGCQLLGISITPFYDDAIQMGTDFDLFCFSLDPDNITAVRSNVAAARYRVGSDALTIGICPETSLVMNCALQNWVHGRAYFRWSAHAHILRTLISDLPSYEFSTNAALGASPLMFPKGGEKSFPSTICIDWGLVCRSAWNTFGALDPIYFWPIPLDDSSQQQPFSNVAFNYFPESLLLKEFSVPLSNRITMTVVLATTEPLREPQFSLQDFQDFGSFLFLWITDAEGNLPMLSPDPSHFPSQFRSIPVSSLQEVPLAGLCNAYRFDLANGVAQAAAEALLSVTSSYTSLEQSYYLQMATASLSYASCLDYFEDFLGRSTQITQKEEKYCPHPADSIEWQNDPCCNFQLGAIRHCNPRLHDIETILFLSDALNSSTFELCTDPDCAASYIHDFSLALNTGECTSVTDVALQDLTHIHSALRSCRALSGFGADFEGISCNSDDDCPIYPFQCSRRHQKCAIDLPTAENVFFECFINHIPIGFAEWLSKYILQSASNTLDENFYSNIQKHARSNDCISQNSLDISTRNRYAWAVDGCGIDCPTLYALDLAYRSNPDQCYQTCYATWDFILVSESDCNQNSQLFCSVESLDCLTNMSMCMYCDPVQPLPCESVPSLPNNENDCLNSIACELPDGTIRFDLSIQECLSYPGECSVDCPGNSCQSALQLAGVCEFIALSTPQACQNSTLSDPLFLQDRCVTTSLDEYRCTLLGGDWVACLTNTNCDINASPTYQYLQCYLSPWQPCRTQQECLAAGYCSDRSTTVRFNPTTSTVDVGGCFTSGHYFYSNNADTACITTDFRTTNGCLRSDVHSAAECLPIHETTAGTEWQIWLNPATSQSECQNASNPARYGCLISSTENRRIWYDPADCQAISGTPSYAFDWTPGVWRTAQVRNLTWQAPHWTPTATWQHDRLSFPTIESWVEGYLDYQSSFRLRSAALCSHELINTPLAPLVCSCQAQHSNCFREYSRLSLVGLTSVCAGDELTLQIPSAFVQFHPDSIAQGCASLQLSEIDRNYLRAPPPPPPVSIKIATPIDRNGTVVNSAGAVIGELVSHGVVFDITLDRPTALNITLCITIPLSLLSEINPQYTVPDFGESPDLNKVIPLDTTVSIFADPEQTVWCSSIQVPAKETKLSFNRFALMRSESLSQSSADWYGQTSVILVYILGAFYSAVFVLLCLVCGYVLWSSYHTGATIHIYIWALPVFAVLCVFRMVYFFAYPSGLWESQHLANFVVFELPTFLYFTAASIILHAIALPIELINPAATRKAKFVLAIFLVLVWLLFISTVVAEALLVENDPGSPCVGRIPYDISSLSDQLRILSLTYQSLIIFFILIQAFLFLVAIMFLLKISKVSLLRGVLGSSLTIVTGLVARCILFIIYLAIDLVSTIYVFITLILTEIIIMIILTIFWTFLRRQQLAHVISKTNSRGSLQLRGKSSNSTDLPSPRYRDHV